MRRFASGLALAAVLFSVAGGSAFAQQSSGSAAAAGAAGISTLVSLAIAILEVVAIWRLFSRAGQPGWASIIPIYNTIVMLHVTGKSGWWLLGLFVPLLNIFVYCRMMVNMAQVFGRGVGFGIGNIFLPFIFLPILAFSNSPYVGPAPQMRAVPAAVPA